MLNMMETQECNNEKASGLKLQLGLIFSTEKKKTTQETQKQKLHSLDFN